MKGHPGGADEMLLLRLAIRLQINYGLDAKRSQSRVVPAQRLAASIEPGIHLPEVVDCDS
jgi:hypothetical protein